MAIIKPTKKFQEEMDSMSTETLKTQDKDPKLEFEDKEIIWSRISHIFAKVQEELNQLLNV